MNGEMNEMLSIAKGKSEHLMRQICLMSMGDGVNLNDIRRLVWDIYRDEAAMIKAIAAYEREEQQRKNKPIEVPVCMIKLRVR